MLEQNTGTKGMFYVNFMCMYASSEILSNVGQIKHFMLYVLCMYVKYIHIHTTYKLLYMHVFKLQHKADIKQT